MKLTKSRIRTLIGVFICLSVLFGGIVGPGQAAVDDRLPEGEYPENCIQADRNTVPESPDVIANVSQSNANNSIINIRYTEVTEQAENLSVIFKHPVDVVNISGFNRSTFSGSYLLNTSAETHVIRYRSGTYPDGTRAFPEGDSWVISSAPTHAGVDVKLQPKESGYIGGSMLFIGEYEKFSLDAGCQQLVAVVPESAKMPAKTTQYLKLVREAAGSMDVGNSYDKVVFFVSPSTLSGGRGGFTISEYGEPQNEIVVSDQQLLISPTQTWVHEYIHTRQDFVASKEAIWINEGIAEYYTARIMLESGSIAPRAYDFWLTEADRKQGDESLVGVRTQASAYHKGGLIIAFLDRALQSRGSSFMEVYTWMNMQDGITWDQILKQSEKRDVGHNIILSVDEMVMNGNIVTTEYVIESSEYRPIAYVLGVSSLRFPKILTGGLLVLALISSTYNRLTAQD